MTGLTLLTRLTRKVGVTGLTLLTRLTEEVGETLLTRVARGLAGRLSMQSARSIRSILPPHQQGAHYA